MKRELSILLSAVLLGITGTEAMNAAGIPESKIEYIGPLPVKKLGDVVREVRKPDGTVVKTNVYYEIKEDVGFIQDWIAVGPFPNLGGRNDHAESEGWDADFLKEYGGEAKIVPYLDMPVKTEFEDSHYWDAGEAVHKWVYHYTWRDHLDLQGFLDCKPLGIYYPQCVSAYAACAVYSDSERRLVLALGADDDYKVWLNHEYLGGERRYGSAFIDQFMYGVTLKKGMNPLMIKCGTDKNAWEFCARFLDANGKPVTDLDIYIPVAKKSDIIDTVGPIDPKEADKLIKQGKGEWYNDRFFLGEDFMQKQDVPKGALTCFTWNKSAVFKDTTRYYWVYVPAQYDPKKPAAVLIVMDGEMFAYGAGDRRSYYVGNVLDNLINKGEIPVTIAILIQSGAPDRGVLPKHHVLHKRHVEYDSINDNFSRMLLDEIIPAVKRDYNLSSDPKDWIIGGFSSGATAATIAAMYHPDVFGGVWAPSASPHDIYGEGNLMSLFYERPIKPVRTYIGSETRSVCLVQCMRQALAMRSAGYDYKFVISPGEHGAVEGEQQMPHALRWLWRDFKKR